MSVRKIFVSLVASMVALSLNAVLVQTGWNSLAARLRFSEITYPTSFAIVFALFAIGNSLADGWKRRDV